MVELVAALMVLVSNMANVGAPPTPPEVKLVEEVVVKTLACGSPEKCPNLHVFTAPDTGVIYVNKNIDFKYTFAKAELFHEVARYVLTQNKIYSPLNSCLKTVKQEDAMDRMELDFIKGQVKEGKYLGVGIPKYDDMPKHVFFCVPDGGAK